jgi:hypothetical protein
VQQVQTHWLTSLCVNHSWISPYNHCQSDCVHFNIYDWEWPSEVLT